METTREHASDRQRAADIDVATEVPARATAQSATEGAGLAAAQAAQLAMHGASATVSAMARRRQRQRAQATQLGTPAQALAVGRQGQAIALPHRARLEQKLGRQLGGLDVFVSAEAVGMVDAAAFAVGHTIVLGEPDPGLEIVAEEVAHTIQQGGDRAPVQAPADLRVTSPDDAVEREAREVAAQAAEPATTSSATTAQQPTLGRVELARTGGGESATDEGLEAFRARVEGSIPEASVASAYEAFKSRYTSEPDAWPIYEHIASWSDFATLADDTVTTTVALYATALGWASPSFDPTTFSTFAAQVPALAELGLLATQELTLYRWLLTPTPEPTIGIDALMAEIGDAAWWTEATSRWSLRQATNVFWPWLHFEENAAGVVDGDARTFFWSLADVLENPSSENMQAFTETHFEGQLAEWSQDKVIALWSGQGEAQALASDAAAGKIALVDKASEDQAADVSTTEQNAVEVLNTMPLAALFDPEPARGQNGDELTLFRVTNPGFGELAWPFWQQMSRTLVHKAELDVDAFLVTGLRNSSVFGSIELPNLMLLRGQSDDAIIDGLTYHLHTSPAREARREAAGIEVPDDLEHPMPADERVESMTDALEWTASYWSYVIETAIDDGERDYARQFASEETQRDAMQNHVLSEYLRLRANPVFEHALDGATSVSGDLGFEHPGVEFGAVSAELDERGHLVGEGSVVMDVGEEGLFSTGAVERTIVPDADVETTLVQGRIDNEIMPEEVDSGLDAIFGPDNVEISARLDDGGVEASVALNALPEGLLPGFTLSAPTATIFVTTSGAVAAFNVGVTHDASGASGDLTVSYSTESGWGVAGELTVPRLELDALEGASVGPLTVAVEVDQSGAYSISAVDGEVIALSATLWGAAIEGSVTGLTLRGTGDGQLLVSGEATVTADMPVIGELGATVVVTDNAIDSVTLTASDRPFAFPADNPTLRGTVGGSLTWTPGGEQSTGASLEATGVVLEMPGLGASPPIDVTLATDDTGLSISAGISAPVEINSLLTLASLDVTRSGAGNYTGGGSLEACVAGQSASVGLTLDDAGVHVESAEATITIGTPDRLQAVLHFTYREQEGLGFGGEVTATVFGDKTITAGVTYNPAVDGGEPSFDVNSSLGESGWELWGGTSYDTTVMGPWGLSLPFWSAGVLTAFATLDAQVDVGLDVTPLVVTGTAEMTGLRFDDAGPTYDNLHLNGGLTGGGIEGSLTLIPSVGLGVSVVHESLAAISGGIRMPVQASTSFVPSGTFDLEVAPGEAIDLEAMMVAPLTFGIEVSPALWGELTALCDTINVPLEAELGGPYPLLEPRELARVEIDLTAAWGEGNPEILYGESLGDGGAGTQMPSVAGIELAEQASQGEEAVVEAQEAEATREPLTEASGESDLDFGSFLSAEGPLGTIVEQIEGMGVLLDVVELARSVYDMVGDAVTDFLEWLSGAASAMTTALIDVATELVDRVQQLQNAGWREVIGFLEWVANEVMAQAQAVADLVIGLIEADEIYLVLSKNDTGTFGADPDRRNYRFHIPGLITLEGHIEGVLESVAMTALEALGLEIKDADELDRPGTIVVIRDNGSPAGMMSDEPGSRLDHGDGLAGDSADKLVLIGVRTGTSITMFEKDDSDRHDGDYIQLRVTAEPLAEDGSPRRIVVENLENPGATDGVEEVRRSNRDTSSIFSSDSFNIEGKLSYIRVDSREEG